MMQGKSYRGIARCFKNGSSQHKQENLHAQCSQSRE
jgi:hypothetical protein